MSRMLPITMLCLALAATASLPGQALAADRGHGKDRGRGGDEAYADRKISLDEAVAQAERRYNARAVRAEEKRKGDRIEYRIRLLGADGRVFEITVDAGSGSKD